MARICGQYQRNTDEVSFVRAMLDYMSAPADLQDTIQADKKLLLGYAGVDKANRWTGNGLAVMLDGAIYNAADFPKGSGDAEKLAMSYLNIGLEKTLGKINGDFAFAIYDSSKHRLVLARDRFGIKPLYYACRKDLFAFASRPGALLRLDKISREPNRKFVSLIAAGHYRTFDNDPEKSPYKDISQVPAASFIMIEDGEIRHKNKYWDLKETPELDQNEHVLSEEYRELIFDAVKIRLGKSHNPAFTLSGGMDSSSVLASAVRASGKKQHAYSSVYPDKTFDETEEINSMLESTVCKWHPVRVEFPDVFPIVKKMIRVNDEPVATATWLSHFILCQQVAQDGFKSLFGGLGGDELNAGEYEYYFYHFADLRIAGKEDILAHEVKLWQKYHDHPIYKKSWDVMEKALATMTDISIPGKCRHDPVRMTRYFNALNPDYYDIHSFEPIMETPFRSYLKNRAYQDITRETAPCCLRAEERQAAAFGLDNLLPFFDHRLAEFMFKIPGEMKIRDGITKVILRRAMKGILPEETRTRIKKTGWNAPAHIWFAHEQKDKLFDLIKSKKFRERGIYNIDKVEQLAKEHFEIVSSHTKKENHMMFFWQLVNLDSWFEEFIEKHLKQN